MSESRQIGKYQITGELGEGGFGVVYQGLDPELERPVAIKLCSFGDEGFQKRFAHEAQIAAGLRHENIVAVLAVDTDEEGSPYLVQELLSGADLRALIEGRAPLEPRRKLEILIAVARGLAHGHAHGVLHRAVHPGNVRVLDDGSVKVLDFGIAKLSSAETELTRESVELGTAGYQPPEQVRGGEIDHRADQFSFGALAYELLAGERPFRGNTLSALVYQILYKIPAPLDAVWADCPAALGDLVGRCLEKKPERRFNHLGEVADELERLHGEVEAGRWPKLLGAATAAASDEVTNAVSRAELEGFGRGETKDSELGEYTISTARTGRDGTDLAASSVVADETRLIDGSPLTTRSFDLETLERSADARAAETRNGETRNGETRNARVAAPKRSLGPKPSAAIDPAAETIKIVRPGVASGVETGGVELGNAAEKIRDPIVADELQSAMVHLESTLDEKGSGPAPTVPAAPVPAPPVTAAPRSQPRPLIGGGSGAHESRRESTDDRTAISILASWKLWAGVAALLAAAIVTWLALRGGDESAPAAATRAAVRPATTQTGTPRAPAPAGPRGAVAVNAVPWAEVTEITDAEGYLQEMPAEPMTPLRLELPPGRYVIHLLHPDHPEPRSCEVEVSEDLQAACNVTFGEVPSVEDYFRASGWWS